MAAVPGSRRPSAFLSSTATLAKRGSDRQTRILTTFGWRGDVDGGDDRGALVRRRLAHARRSTASDQEQGQDCEWQEAHSMSVGRTGSARTTRLGQWNALEPTGTSYGECWPSPKPPQPVTHTERQA
jgi:hypothetical protein